MRDIIFGLRGLVLATGISLCAASPGHAQEFERNIMTFNPGWSRQAKNLEADFTDIREIQKQLKADGVELTTEADESTKGPASITLIDPDGNPILIDQHR